MSIYDGFIRIRDTSRLSNDKDTLSIVTVIIGEIQRANIAVNEGGEKRYPDEKVIAVLKTLRKQWVDNPNEAEGVRILDLYIPNQLSEADLKLLLKRNNFSNIGDFMKYLKTEYAGLYDGKTASAVFNAK